MMKSPRSLLAAFFLLFALALPGLSHAAVPFAQAESDLKPDPTARYGTLPNGLRYVIRPNQEPKDRASLRFVVAAGSFHETEDQRGLAHFLEHMAFNGSTHYPDGDELIKYFQRLGMNFGGDTNANTSFDRTQYLLELPDTKPATVAEGLRVFSDHASGLLLKQSEIDQERGIILSEKRTRDSVGYRTLIAQYDFAFDGSLFPRRLPIGETEVIQQSSRDRFVAFYDTWYRPELISIVVVGDIDAAAVEQQIIATFTPLSARAPARPKPDLGRLNLSATEGTRAFYHYEPEQTGMGISINTIIAHAPDSRSFQMHVAAEVDHQIW